MCLHCLPFCADSTSAPNTRVSKVWLHSHHFLPHCLFFAFSCLFCFSPRDLGLFGVMYQLTIDLVAYKQRTVFPIVLVGPIFRFTDSQLLSEFTHDRRSEGVLGVSHVRILISFTKAPSFYVIASQRPCLQIPGRRLGVRFRITTEESFTR